MAGVTERRVRNSADRVIEVAASIAAAELPELRRAVTAELARRFVATVLVEQDRPLTHDAAQDLIRAEDRLAVLVRSLIAP
jgi:oligoribonuclease (3'-5' exoribonuclease)